MDVLLKRVDSNGNSQIFTKNQPIITPRVTRAFLSEERCPPLPLLLLDHPQDLKPLFVVGEGSGEQLFLLLN